MLDAEQEALFAAPREAFVTERTRIARELKKAGRAQEAAEIAKVPKPTLAAWVVNQLARQRRPLVKQLGLAGQRLREVQLGMMSGHGRDGEGDARAAFARATAAQREALSNLRAAAQELLTEAGSGAPVHLLEAVLRTLRSGAASDIAQATIEQGRLLREIDAQDLGALAAAIPAFAFAMPGAGDGGMAKGAAHQAAAGPRAVAAAEAKTRTGAPAHAGRASAEHEAERARQAAERAAERARAEARAVAQREVDHVRRAFEKVDKERARLDDEVARAREALAEAECRAATAQEGADTAAERLAAAERRLRELPA
jgi:hypothetical protein